jgi:phage-related protein
VTNLVITHEGTEKKLDFTGTAIGPQAVITIDMHTATPTVRNEANEDWSDYLVGSHLNSFAVLVGSNTINVAGAGATGTTRVYLEY